MKFYYDLYVSEELRLKKEELISNLREKKLLLNKYLIVLTENPANHLEYFDSVLLKQPSLADRDIFVIGIATGKNGARKMVKQMVQDILEETGGTDIRGYFLKMQKKFETTETGNE